MARGHGGRCSWRSWSFPLRRRGVTVAAGILPRSRRWWSARGGGQFHSWLVLLAAVLHVVEVMMMQEHEQMGSGTAGGVSREPRTLGRRSTLLGSCGSDPFEAGPWAVGAHRRMRRRGVSRRGDGRQRTWCLASRSLGGAARAGGRGGGLLAAALGS